MRRLLAALAFLASCSSLTARQEEIREAFEAWRDGAAAGDAERTFRGMSAGLKSEWAFQRLAAGDSLALDWRARLTGTARTDLDLWLEHQKKYRKGRALPLPATVLEDPSFGRMWADCFRRDLQAVKFQFAGLAVTSVYTDDNGATVVARNVLGRSEMYSMALEPDGWKVDGHRESLRPLPK